MMKSHTITSILGASTLLFFSYSHAVAEPVVEEEKQLPWYQVEVLVVEPTDPGLTNEKWPVVIEEASQANMVELSAPIQPVAKVSGTNTPAEAFQLLNPDEYQLLSVAEKLEKRDKYKVMLHVAWRQPLEENAESPAVHIHNGLKDHFLADSEQTADTSNEDTAALPVLNSLPDALPEELPEHNLVGPVENFVDGSITMTLTRYLHIKTHMVYFNPEVDLGRQIAEQENDTPVVERFLLKESRRVRRKEIHYLDHPYFGIIARVTRYEPEKEVN